MNFSAKKRLTDDKSFIVPLNNISVKESTATNALPDWKNKNPIQSVLSLQIFGTYLKFRFMKKKTTNGNR